MGPRRARKSAAAEADREARKRLAARWGGALAALAMVGVCAPSWGCVDVVARAREDGGPGGFGRAWRTRAPRDTELPEALRLEPEWQRCEATPDCVLARGVPGQRREALCCASCEARVVALNAAQASRLSAWKAALGCEAMVCGPLGDCAEEVGRWEAACVGGVCRLQARETTTPSAP